MKHFKIRIRDKAFNDLQDIVDYYNQQQQQQQHGLGKRFYTLFEHALGILQINPYFMYGSTMYVLYLSVIFLIVFTL